MKNLRHMVMNRSCWKTSIIACFLAAFLFSSCNGGSENAENVDLEGDELVEEDAFDQPENEVYYQIPSPDEMIALIQQGGFEYDGSVLNSIDNFSQYVDQKSQAFNLGIYTSDLNYMATYGQFQESVTYFNVVMKLSDALGVSSAFDEALVNRVKSNLNNADSLKLITNDSYYSIVDNLERDGRGKLLAVIAAGGWLESVYIVLNLMDSYEDSESVLQRIADQKLVFENLILYLKKYEGESIVDETIADLAELETIFESLEETSTSTSISQEEGAKKVLGGAGKINISKAQFSQLKEAVLNLRNKMSANVG